MNINKLFKFISIRRKLIIAFILLSILPIGVLGVYGIYSQIELMKERAVDKLRDDQELNRLKVKNIIDEVKWDIFYFLSEQFRFNKYQIDEHVSNLLINYLENRKIYYQIKIFDSNKNLLLAHQKINNNFADISSEINHQGFQFYFYAARDLRPEDILIIPSELRSIKNERISAITFIDKIHTENDNTFFILALDIFADHFFSLFTIDHNNKDQQEIFILDSNGNYLYHSKYKNDWNKLLAEHKQIAEETSEILPKLTRLNTSKTVTTITTNSNLFLISELFDNPKFLNNYYLISKINEAFIYSPAYNYLFILIIILLGFLFFSIIIAFIATEQISKPIKQIRRGAEIVAGGDFNFRLEVETNDEIEELGNQFNRMAEELAMREKELLQHKNHLESLVFQRTSELNKEKEILKAIMNNVPSAFLLIDTQNIITLASEAVRQIFDIEPADFYNRNMHEFIELLKLQTISEFLRSNENFTEFIFTAAEGKERIVEVMKINVKIKNLPEENLLVFSDVTERRRSEHHLLKVEKLVTIGETAALIAHEVRNSLTSVKMLLQLQYESANDSSKLSLETSLKSISNVEKVVNNLLLFAKGTQLEIKEGNIIELFEDLLSFMKPRFNKSIINYRLTTNNINTKISFDFISIREAFANILLNAIDAMGIGGNIIITLEEKLLEDDLEDFAFIDNQYTGKNSLYVKLTKGLKILKISISDDGPGIDRKNIEKIFDPFFTTKKGGSGLGLSMVKRTINKHKGIIKVHSQNGEGTVFNIFLPMEK
ncbi:MAG: HAMP domain-containing protein [Bacteroidetes bacterium]|nr:HAMP domain-containing protein [Bacteroidota bacterium]MBU2507029.1 HAMP domain-containing protein [Bacteroidota bacterium]